MKIASNMPVLAIAILLLANVTSSVVAAGQTKKSDKQHGAVSTNKNSKQSTNQKAQWSADPDRGWVRSEESQSSEGRNRLSTTPKKTDGKNKGSAKASKRF